MLIVTFHLSMKIIVFGYFSFFDVAKLVMSSCDRQRSVLPTSEKQFGWAETIRTRNIPPFINGLFTVLTSSQTFR